MTKLPECNRISLEEYVKLLDETFGSSLSDLFSREAKKYLDEYKESENPEKVVSVKNDPDVDFSIISFSSEVYLRKDIIEVTRQTVAFTFELFEKELEPFELISKAKLLFRENLEEGYERFTILKMDVEHFSEKVENFLLSSSSIPSTKKIMLLLKEDTGCFNDFYKSLRYDLNIKLQRLLYDSLTFIDIPLLIHKRLNVYSRSEITRNVKYSIEKKEKNVFVHLSLNTCGRLDNYYAWRPSYEEATFLCKDDKFLPIKDSFTLYPREVKASYDYDI